MLRKKVAGGNSRGSGGRVGDKRRSRQTLLIRYRNDYLR